MTGKTFRTTSIGLMWFTLISAMVVWSPGEIIGARRVSGSRLLLGSGASVGRKIRVVPVDRHGVAISDHRQHDINQILRDEMVEAWRCQYVPNPL